MQPTACKRGRLWSRLFAPLDIAFLVFFRIAFGGFMIWWFWKRLAGAEADSFHIATGFVPTYYFFDWLRPWPGIGMYVHFWGLVVCGCCVMLGLAYRLSASLLALGYAYVFLLEKMYYNNHFYLIGLLSLVMVFLPANRACSIDVLLRPKIHSTTAPAWTLWLLRVQIAIPYFYGGFAKLSPDWLAGEPMRSFFSEEDFAPHLGPIFRGEAGVMFFTYGGLIFDLAVVPLMLWKRTRLFGFAAAILFNLNNAFMFQIGIFPWLMMAATLLFFPPSWPRAVFLWQSPADLPQHDWTPPARLSASQKLTLTLLGLYLSVQLLVPFRHLLYPGDANWTDEGQTFAWRMMLRTKSVTRDSRVYVYYPKSGRKVTVLSAEHDSSDFGQFQRATIMGNPDLLLQYCHYVSRELRAKHSEPFEIRADVAVSMNGRNPQRLVDGNVDLAAQPRSLKSASWIMPLVEPLRTP